MKGLNSFAHLPRKGQAQLEYALLIGAVIAGIIAVIYANRNNLTSMAAGLVKDVDKVSAGLTSAD